MQQNQPLAFECPGWEVDLAKREIRANGIVVPLGSRAFEIAAILVQAAGELVTKDELLSRVWPDVTVGDNTVEVHISAIRRALGADRNMLKTISGRGYRLSGEWKPRHDSGQAASPPAQVSGSNSAVVTNVPVAASALVGRQAAVKQLCDLISAYRIVTLVGPGGIGKTVLASEVARQLLPTIGGDVIFVELVSLSDPDLVSSTIAYALDLKMRGDDTSPAAVGRAIGDRKILIVLDNCEHLIEAAANSVETLTRLCPHVTVLATSRELLGVDGEFLYRVPVLDVPTEESEETGDILGHSAVQLFVTRTKSQQADFELDPAKLATVGAICRHLDGIPLAIEFAAARAATLGIRQVERHLDDRLAFLTSSRRTALPRHKTLRATLDWSYELLPSAERQLLRYLAAFPAGFTLEAASAVSIGASEADVALGISNLVSKSLVVLDNQEGERRWRLLETVRVYAMEKLVEAGEHQGVVRRHAKFVLGFFRPFSVEGGLQSALDSLGRYRREVDNLRSALRWAFSIEGDAATGVELAAVSADFWIAVSLLTDAQEWAVVALQHIDDEAGSLAEMVLRASLGFALLFTEGTNPQAREEMARVLELARQFNNADFEQRAIFGLFLYTSRSTGLAEALSLTHDYEAAAKMQNLEAQAFAAWLVGISQTYAAAHVDASERLEWAIEQYCIPGRQRDIVRFGGDLRSSALSHNTVNLLSRGFLDTASRDAHRAVDEARGANHPAVLCVALAWAAGFVFVNIGDLETAGHYNRELLEHAHKHAFRPYYAVGVCVRGNIAAELGDPEAGIHDLSAGLAEMQRADYTLFYPSFRTRLAMALDAIGRTKESEQVIDQTLTHALDVGYRWFVPEILRVKGELLWRHAPDDAPACEDLFRRSMNQARAQDALYWELSAATSLADLLDRQGRTAAGRAALAQVYARIKEGRDVPRVRQAKALLDRLGAASA